MPVEEQLATIFEVLEGGAEVPAGEIVQFPTDIAGAGSALEGTTTTVELGNGIATEVAQVTATEAGTTTTAGVGLLAMDVGAVGVAIAPALGILAGVGLYNLTPEFWRNVSNSLLDAGQTIGGKVRAYINGETKELGFSAETIEIFKNAFLEAGLFDVEIEQPEAPTVQSGYQITTGISFENFIKSIIIEINNLPESSSFLKAQALEKLDDVLAQITAYGGIGDRNFFTANIDSYANGKWDIVIDAGKVAFPITGKIISGAGNSSVFIYRSITNGLRITNTQATRTITSYNPNQWYIGAQYSIWSSMPHLLIGNGNATIQANENLQPGAKYPDKRPIPEIYPAWNPWSVPVEGFPNVYPIEIPAIKPDPDQQQAQTPQEIPDNDPNALDWLIETLPQPDPNPNPYPEPAPNPDPDPVPEPEPIPEPEPEPTPDNPPNPNPDPSSPFLPVVPDMPETVESNAMFTVYKPSMAQVNSFGGWLWSSNIVEQIKRIWQNPLDGIISFMKVYVNAPTSGSDTIKVGILDSGVSSPVVSGQFVTVECGSLNVREKFYNATDYSPFVSMHLYLPFIGIVELDIDEFMSGEIKVTYHVDVYTGTCLAEVKSRRSPDMPEWTIVYTFSGNASQQLPLTSAEFSGALSSLVGVVGGGLAIASGGGLGLLAGASGIAHAVSHEMVHLAHSGSLSANAGIMGARKPYLILTRRRGYDANGYNELYGYPSNKTVYLNNCSGYVKVKDIRLKTVATDSERMEIENLLKAGVII